MTGATHQANPDPAAATTAAELSVRPVHDGRAWDAFVRSRPDASFCHLWGWRAIFDLYGHDSAYAAAIDANGEIRGVLPTASIRTPVVGRHVISVPLLNSGGPVGTEDARRLLTGWVLRKGWRSGADVIQLRTRTEPPADAPISRHKVAVVLDLPESPDILWNDVFRSKLRSQIRRPRKEGMQARFGDAQLEAFYRVFARNMRDLGTPVHPRWLFERIRGEFGDRVVFGAVYWDGRPVAGGCGFVWRDEFEMTWASSLRECRRQAPNMLLYWAFMERMIERGVRRFDFGRSTPGDGAHRFKRQWGGADEGLPWVHWSRGDEPRIEPAAGWLPRLGRAVWQRLPTPIANRVGPIVARRLPWW